MGTTTFEGKFDNKSSSNPTNFTANDVDCVMDNPLPGHVDFPIGFSTNFTGNVKFNRIGGGTCLIHALAGVIYPAHVKRFLSVGTDAGVTQITGY